MRKKITDARLLALYKIVGNNITRLRGTMSQVDLALKAGMSRGTLSAAENGLNIEMETVVKIADALGVHPAILFLEQVSANSMADMIRQIAKEEAQKEFHRLMQEGKLIS